MTPYQLHKKNWSNCTRCSLHLTRQNVVLAKGSIPCDVLLIGEAPGESENAIGSPFVGPAGKVLDQIIEKARSIYVNGDSGVLRYAFTNLVGCIPLREGEKQEPKKESIEACAPRLTEMVEMCGPRLMVAVGALSEKWLPNVMYGPIDHPATIIGITHPAAILRADISRRGVMFQQAVVTLADALGEI